MKENVPPPESCTIRRYGFVGLGVVLLEEGCHYESRLGGLLYA